MSHIRDLIESSLAEDLALERLAAEAGIASHAFAAAFTKAFGIPPYRYVIMRRVERAKSLLRHSDLPISRIAYETGFASQSHLATTFKRSVGETPVRIGDQSPRGRSDRPARSPIRRVVAGGNRWCPRHDADPDSCCRQVRNWHLWRLCRPGRS